MEPVKITGGWIVDMTEGIHAKIDKDEEPFRLLIEHLPSGRRQLKATSFENAAMKLDEWITTQGAMDLGVRMMKHVE